MHVHPFAQLMPWNNYMEIELRFKVKNLKLIENKLINLKAKFIKNKKQIDKYFGEINLYKKINYSFLLRIRQEGDKVFLTYKGDNFKKAGVWQEYDFLIKDSKKAELMIKDMGFDEVITVNKIRKEYSLNSLNICLDEIEGLGQFIEIEYLSESSNSKKKHFDLIKRLGIEKNEIIHKGYVTMLLEKDKSKFAKYIIN